MAENEVRGPEEKPFKIEITKNTKGYNWTIRVYGDDPDEVTRQVEKLNDWAKNTYGDQT